MEPLRDFLGERAGRWAVRSVFLNGDGECCRCLFLGAKRHAPMIANVRPMPFATKAEKGVPDM